MSNQMESCNWGHLWLQVERAGVEDFHFPRLRHHHIDHKLTCISSSQTSSPCNSVSIDRMSLFYHRAVCRRGSDQSNHLVMVGKVQEVMEVVAVLVDCPCTYYNSDLQ